MKESFVDKIEEAVKKIEAGSSAEVVVSVRQSSAAYRELDLLWSLIFALGVLAYKIWSPYYFHPDWILINVLFCALFGFLLSSKVAPMRRVFLTSGRRESETMRTAQSEFVRLGVSRTSGRTGLLILVSRLERKLVMIPDQALEQQIVPTLWEEWSRKFGTASSDEELLSGLMELLKSLKGPLSRQLPRTEGDVNELPDRPVQVEE